MFRFGAFKESQRGVGEFNVISNLQKFVEVLCC